MFGTFHMNICATNLKWYLYSHFNNYVNGQMWFSLFQCDNENQITDHHSRCVFQQEQPAGQGAPFPYPHWTNENDRDVWSTSVRQIDTGRFPSGRMGNITPDSSFFKESRRPSKMRCDRTCLISPQLIFEHLISKFPKFSSSVSQSKPKACPAGRYGNIRNLPYIITHVICEHAGNPFTMSGARELILAQHAITMTNRKLCTVHDVVRLTEAWISALEGVKGDDLKALLVKTSTQSRESGRLSQLTTPDSKGSSEGRITNKNRNAVSAPQARTSCQSSGTFCQLEKRPSGRPTRIPRYGSTISERLLWGSMSGVSHNEPNNSLLRFLVWSERITTILCFLLVCFSWAWATAEWEHSVVGKMFSFKVTNLETIIWNPGN